MTDAQRRPVAESDDPPQSSSESAMDRLLDRPLTDEDVRQATERVAQPRSRPVHDVASLLLFRVGTERLAVPATDVARVTRVNVVRRIPHRSNRVIRGLCNIEGELLICGNISALLDLTDTPQVSGSSGQSADLARMIVLGAEPSLWAIEVDEVQGVQYFETRSYKQPPVTVQQAMYRFTASLIPLGDHRVATLLDVPQVVSGFEGALS